LVFLFAFKRTPKSFGDVVNLEPFTLIKQAQDLVFDIAVRTIVLIGRNEQNPANDISDVL
jgi:hypothetical protein